MNPVDICRDLLGPAKLDAILEELSSPQIKALLKGGSIKVKLPGGYVSRQKRMEIFKARVHAAIDEGNGDLSAELMQQWLLRCRRTMLMEFLDRLGVKHRQGETDESFLLSTSTERIREAAAWLLSRHDRAEAAAYLHYIAHQQRSKVFDDWVELQAKAQETSP